MRPGNWREARARAFSTPLLRAVLAYNAGEEAGEPDALLLTRLEAVAHALVRTTAAEVVLILSPLIDAEEAHALALSLERERVWDLVSYVYDLELERVDFRALTNDVVGAAETLVAPEREPTGADFQVLADAIRSLGESLDRIERKEALVGRAAGVCVGDRVCDWLPTAGQPRCQTISWPHRGVCGGAR